jgi:hypothetical protein
MKLFVTCLATVAALGLAAPAMAQQAYQPFPAVAAPPLDLSTCPEIDNVEQMHQNMMNITQDMDGMIRNTADSGTRGRLEQLRDQVNNIASDMVGMSPSMCGKTGTVVVPSETEPQ